MRLAYGALSVAGTIAILLTTLGFSFTKPKLADLTPQQREAVESLTRSLTAKLLHPQLVALRKSMEEDEEK